MKKVIALVLVVMMAFSCTGCADFMKGFEAGMKEAAAEANKEVSRGVINENVYSSEYSGLTFTKPDSWVYSTDEEIADLMGVAIDDMTDASEFSKAVAEMSSIYDMMVVDNYTGNNISIMYENLKISNGSDMTENAYIDALKEQLAVNNMGYEIQENADTVSLSGNTYQRMTTAISYEGIQMQQYYYVRNINSFMNVVIVTIVDGTPVADIEAMFS